MTISNNYHNKITSHSFKVAKNEMKTIIYDDFTKIGM